MSSTIAPRRRGFTLVEMLVVIGIIVVLAALLLPAVMSAMNRARTARIGIEIAELDKAVNAYKAETGDYPPNFRDFNLVMRHIRTAYPKITPGNLANFVAQVWPGYDPSMGGPPPVPQIDEGESLVFWLYLIDNDPRDPFKAVTAGSVAQALTIAQSPKRHYPFKEDRLISDDGDQFPSYRANYCKDTFYVYIDSRSYTLFVDSGTPSRAAYAEDSNVAVRPYWSETVANVSNNSLKPMNPTTFQIIAAGQDGNFGTVHSVGAKIFPTGGRTDANFVRETTAPNNIGYSDGDRDNLTNFSEGARLEDKIP